MTLSPCPPAPSVAFFCPQSKAPTEEYLQQLQALLTTHPHLQRLAGDVESLGDAWSILASHRPDIAALPQGQRYVNSLREWITHGRAGPVAGAMSGILSLPLLVVVQTCQYFQFLELAGLSHADFLAGLRNGGGAQGYCGGLLPAFAIACAKDEAEVVAMAAKAMRIALAVGAFGELGDDETIPGPTTIVVRLKYAGQGEDIVNQFPGCYISAVTDPKTISIVGPVPKLQKVTAHARDQGLLVSSMHIRGKVHNPENAELAEILCQICEQHEEFQLPSATALQIPVRSNGDGQPLENSSLTHEAVYTILASRCEWYKLLTEVANDLQKTGVESHTFALYGIGDPVPLAPFHQAHLKVSKIDVFGAIKNARLAEYTYPDDAVAVTGVACRLPGANSLDELWDLMAKGTSTCEEIRLDRIPMGDSFRAAQDAKWTSKQKFYGNFVDDIDKFDNTFFRHNPKEAAHMDVQQRMLLELAFQAMDSSGYLRYHRREDNDDVGCFIGASFVEYQDNTGSFAPTAYTATGMIRAFLCGRISYYFGWRGPAEVIDTACSSSLVAINRAVRAIRTGECKMALTGGVNLMSSVHNYLNLAKAGFLSPTGQCKPFDQSADGYCRSDGAGLVVLKPLKDAIAAGDQIFGVIAGAATNQGGLSASITVPSSPAQVELYRGILNQARMDPEHVSYVEAHGTGTQAGDPLEVASLREVFGGPDRGTPLHLGSIKGNIGHCEAAAGVAGLVKVLAMLHSGSIPPLANFKALNPKIPALQSDKMSIARAAEPWNAPVRAACVNSYGAAGSNAAVLCGESPLKASAISSSCSTFPVLVSAATKESLDAYVRILKAFLNRRTPSIGDLAYTLSERRKRHRFRLAVTASETPGLVRSLDVETGAFEVPQKRKSVVLVFSGQSKQTVGVEKSVYDAYPRFRRYIDTCNDILVSSGYPSILPAIFQTEALLDVLVLQTGTFAVQYASAKCWIDAGVPVDCTIGHSFGELTALTVSGVFSLEDGLKVVAARAKLMMTKWGAERGTMLAIHANQDAVHSVVASTDGLEVACYNAPGSFVVVGTSAAISEAEALLRDDARYKSIRSQRLDVSHGFHSKFTDPLLSELAELAESITFRAPEISIETCTKQSISSIAPEHLVRQTRNPVYFLDAVQRIEQRLGDCIWLEAGMDTSIIPMVKRAVARQDGHSFQAIKFKDASNVNVVLPTATTNLWRQGLEASFWGFLDAAEAGLSPIYLPPYQFQRTAAWLPNIDRATEAQKAAAEVNANSPEQQTLPPPLRLVTLKGDSGQADKKKDFAVHINTQRFTTIVSGHAVRRQPLCPASLYMECAVMAAQILLGDVSGKALCFDDVSFEAPLGVDQSRNVSISLEETGNHSWKFVLSSTSTSDSRGRQTTHGKGTLRLAKQPKLQSYQRLVADRIKELRGNTRAEKLMAKRAYGLFSQVVHYADFLQGISSITMDGTQAVADIQVSAGHVGGEESTVTQICDTVALDTFIQVAGLLINSSDCCVPDHVFVATGLDSAITSKLCDFSNCKSWTVYAMFSPSSETTAAGDVFVLTNDGSIAMTVLGVRFTRLPISKLEKMLESANRANSTTMAVPVRTSVIRTPPPEAVPELITDVENDWSMSSTSSDSGSPATPDEYEGGEESHLREIISTYTGAAVTDIAPDVNMGDLGVDSLAAVELADDLRNRFGRDISSDDLLMSSFDTLSSLLLSAKPKRPMLPRTQPPKAVSTPPAPPKKVEDGRRQRLLEILAESSGAQVSSIREEETLRDLGLDSLSAVELKSELEEAFSVEVTDEQVHLDSTVREVLQFLGVDGGNAAGNVPSASDPAATGITAHDNNKPVEPATLNDPAATLVECEASFNTKARNCGFTDYWTVVAPKQDELLLAYILEAFKTLGADIRSLAPGDRIPVVKHLPKHRKVMARYNDILSKHNIIKKDGGSYVRSAGRCPEDSSEDLLSAFMDQFPAYRCDAVLISLTGPKLAGCLMGTDDPIALLFGSSKAQRAVEDFYTNSPMLATLTELLVDTITRVVSGSGKNTVRILEVGAGFGGTTKRLAEALQGVSRPLKYAFTDIAATLVRSASKKLAKYDWMEFHSLNLEQDPPAWMKGHFDIAIGTNCVHATTNRAATMSRVRDLLNKDGFAVLSEITQIIDWYDVVYGLLDGWWMSTDSDYALVSPETWMRSFAEAGFTSCTYSQGSTPEANSQRLLLASKKQLSLPPRAVRPAVDTVVYKEVDGVQIHADVYLPRESSVHSMPVALLLHGGGHMTLSRKAIRPAQVSFLLENGVLPISFDYRLCPEVNLMDGPITDIRDAYAWAHTELPRVVSRWGVNVDTERVAMIGWSTGGHLAMSTAWTATEVGLQPPKAILSFYGPTDFESGDLDARRAEEYPERQLALEDIIKSLPRRPITHYDATGPTDSTGLGWVRPGDPRSELVLSLFKEGNGLPLLLNGLPSSSSAFSAPSPQLVAAISPLAHVRDGTYTVPTCIIHGENDEIVPYHMAVEFVEHLKEADIEAELLTVPAARHIHDLKLRPGVKGWKEWVEPGYGWVFKKLGL
ncbi:BcPKS16, polyketide synthase [Macrophomina phaseolina]|uniref:BcPKS16, polyketide synthase n=1 Tax=Macrophomina phaseolina TaxID=35725 RepID=A0ABQ8FTD9_9PEZI|nr:BcPKS16, polyketide synthase [Macrophomina phaseolina]